MDTTSARSALADLADRWLRQRPPASPWEATFEPVEVPTALRETITVVEPYRAQTLADAAVYLSLPFLAGFGLEVDVAFDKVAPYGRWPAAVAQLTVQASWSLHMDGREPDSYTEGWDLVALEDGVWKIVRLWDGETRRRVAAEIAAILAYRAGPSDGGAS